jgi:hypothetical protein
MTMVPEEFPNSPARDLEEALARMRFRLEGGRFWLLGFTEDPLPEDLAALTGSAAGQLIREGGETTLLLCEQAARAAHGRHPGARVERDLVWIRFEAPMGWELVGFLARVTTHLAAAGVPLGAVCGYSRDHLFVAARHLERARAALAELFPEA